MRINKVAFAITTLLAASQVHASGFQINEHSASGLGRAFAGEAAIGDDAASLARNPALMATFDRAQLSVVGTYVAPDVNITGSDEKNSASDVAPAAVVPAMYYVQPINDQWAFGLAMYSNFGTGTEYADDYVNNAAAGTTHIVTATFNPNVSFRINEQFSIGAGVSAIYTTAELKRNSPETPTFPGLPNIPAMNLADMEGDGINFSWNVGALYEVNENHRFGISYKHSSEMNLEGEFTGVASLGSTIEGTMDNTLPAILELSGYHKLTDKFAVSYSWQYTTWSDFGNIVAHDLEGNEVLRKDEDFNNSSRYSVGTEYYATENLTLRAGYGYAYDEQAAASTLSIPDSDRQWYTAGMTYKATESLSFDMGAAFIAGKEVTFDEDIPLSENKTFTSKGDAWLYSAQLNYSF